MPYQLYVPQLVECGFFFCLLFHENRGMHLTSLRARFYLVHHVGGVVR